MYIHTHTKESITLFTNSQVIFELKYLFNNCYLTATRYLDVYHILIIELLMIADNYM